MHDDFGVSIRIEAVAIGFQLGPQLLVILDNAIVNDGQVIARHMGMGIVFTGYAVGGPARVGDTRVALHRIGIQGGLQLGCLAQATAALN